MAATVFQLILPVRDLFIWGESILITKGSAPWFSTVQRRISQNFWCGFVQFDPATNTCWGIRYDREGPSSLYGKIGETRIELYHQRIHLVGINNLLVTSGKSFPIAPYRLYIPGNKTGGYKNLHGQDDFLADNAALLSPGDLIQQQELLTALRTLPLEEQLLAKYYKLLDGGNGEEFLLPRLGLTGRVWESLGPLLDGSEQSAAQWHKTVEVACATTLILLQRAS
jgi:hypothetical protein